MPFIPSLKSKARVFALLSADIDILRLYLRIRKKNEIKINRNSFEGEREKQWRGLKEKTENRTSKAVDLLDMRRNTMGGLLRILPPQNARKVIPPPFATSTRHSYPLPRPSLSLSSPPPPHLPFSQPRLSLTPLPLACLTFCNLLSSFDQPPTPSAPPTPTLKPHAHLFENNTG